ncbi:hypothetical protein FRC10_007592 [Ceratobasidium sp. 414]|nr:hypothetical protein FRC10_007592 [Ceratobasidium sp. 414]
MPSLSSYTAPTTQEAPNPSPQFIQGHPYADSELPHLRPFNALDLAALQAYLTTPQYSDFSTTPTPSSINTLDTSSMGVSVPGQREGSPDSSEGSAAYRS